MNPIDGISDIVRLPRLGKIRLGIKVAGDKNPYPQATDYFVVPDEIKNYVGQKPKTLEIMFPTERPDEFAAHVPTLIEAGANILGGCCGTGPEHIRRVAALVASRTRAARRRAKQ